MQVFFNFISAISQSLHVTCEPDICAGLNLELSATLSQTLCVLHLSQSLGILHMNQTLSVLQASQISCMQLRPGVLQLSKN